MIRNTLNIFLTNYVMSLAERTRIEKNNIKIGFDWIIYNLALVSNWTPVRLPFFRQPEASAAKTKTEAEFGIDFSFLLPDRDALLIFVLKDEELNNQNWTKHNFDSDLRMASAPDLSSKELSLLKEVKIILAYNKDENKTGIDLFNCLTASLGTKIGDGISLSFERWNLTKIIEEVKENLISPDLLPQYLSSLFSYICSQAADFNFGSMEWENQLIPNWKNFIKIILNEPIEERKLRLIPVSLLILYQYKKNTPDSYPGWIDLIEWAMLPLWECYRSISDKKLKTIIIEIWLQLYVAELERYFIEIAPVLTTEHGLHNKKAPGLTPINDAHIAYWHIGRLGILTLAPQDFFVADDDKEGKSSIANLVNRTVEWLARCLRMNPSTMRPLIDLNHIELFLIWLILWQAGREGEIYEWLSDLESRLLVRRIGNANLPFIEGRNRMDLVAEYAATSIKPPEYTDNSSYLLLMILELCFSLEDKYRDELLNRYYKRIVRGIGDDNNPLANFEIDLIGWSPPDDWAKRILKEQVTDGIAITTGNFERVAKADDPLSKKIEEFIMQSREKFPFKRPCDIPLTVYILACIKHRSPLPPEFWRGIIFKNKSNKNDNNASV